MKTKEDDAIMLDTLLEYESSLDEWERKAFADMKEKLVDSEKGLTKSQKEKVDAAWKRLGLDDRGSKNLWSSGKVPMGKPMDFPYNMHRPLRPPGR